MICKTKYNGYIQPNYVVHLFFEPIQEQGYNVIAEMVTGSMVYLKECATEDEAKEWIKNFAFNYM